MPALDLINEIIDARLGPQEPIERNIVAPASLTGGSVIDQGTNLANATQRDLVRQNTSLNKQFGSVFRDSFFRAAPTLARSAAFFGERAGDTVASGLQSDFFAQFGAAQAARGGADVDLAPSGSTDRFLEVTQDRNQFSGAQALSNIGFGTLAGAGLDKLPTVNVNSLSSVILGEARLDAEREAGIRQSEFAERAFNDVLRSGAFDSPNTGGGVSVTTGGNTGVGGAGEPTSFDPSGNPIFE